MNTGLNYQQIYKSEDLVYNFCGTYYYSKAVNDCLVALDFLDNYDSLLGLRYYENNY